MQDALAARLLNRSGMEALNRQTVNALHKGDATAAGKSPEQLRAVAEEFEALFLNYMLSVMRETVEDSGLTEQGPGQGIYTELFDQEVARSLARRGALGISDILIRKLSEKPTPIEGEGGKGEVAQKPTPSGSRDRVREEEGIPDFRMPVEAQVSSAYGIRQDPFTHELRLHRGVDIAAPEGMQVHAACAGVVVSSGYEQGYGNTVVVRHPGGFETRYAHLNTLKVKAGDQVQLSGVLGTVGNTGHSTGPHLHFEVVRNGNQMDPEALLPH